MYIHEHVHVYMYMYMYVCTCMYIHVHDPSGRSVATVLGPNILNIITYDDFTQRLKRFLTF